MTRGARLPGNRRCPCLLQKTAQIDFSSAKFAVRGLADAMARELWPQGIHVAHILIDGVIAADDNREENEGDPLLEPAEIADVYWDLIQQKPSAWTFELEVRPFSERFNV